MEEEYQLPGVLEELPETCWGRDLLGTPEALGTNSNGESRTLGEANASDYHPGYWPSRVFYVTSLQKGNGVSDHSLPAQSLEGPRAQKVTGQYQQSWYLGVEVG